MARILLRHPLHFTDIRELFTHHERDVLGSILAITKAVAEQLGKQTLDKQKRRIEAETRLRECGDNPCPDCPPVSLTVPDELQDTLWRCGPAALRAVCRFHDIDASENLLARIAGTSVDNGTSPEALEKAANRLGLATDARANSCLDDVAHALRLGAPCICAVQTDGGGHWVVVKGVDEKNVTLMDPLQGTTTEPRSTFEQRWWDTANGKKYVRYALAVGKKKVKESVGAVGVGQLPGNPQSITRVMESGLLADLLPQEAIDYLRGLVVALGIDPAPLLPELRRNAFTLAVTTDSEILERVKSAIVDKLASGDVGSGAQAVQQVLDAAGISTTSPAYAETVFRTNAMSAYNEAAQQQLNREIDTFPVWRYSNPDDSRSRPHHAERDGRYYPSSVAFEDVRGRDIGDVVNCRCVAVPLTKWDWEELRLSGARIADGYPDVVMESESFFANCSRDEHGHCKTGTGGSSKSESDNESSKGDSSDAPLTADEKKEAKAAWEEHAKAKEAHAKEVESLEASHAKAMEEHAAKVKEIDAAHAEVVKAHEEKVKDIEASHAKAVSEWEARDEARTARRDAVERDHVTASFEKTKGIEADRAVYNEDGAKGDYEADAKVHADDWRAKWKESYGEGGHLDKAMDELGATPKERERVASVAKKGEAAVDKAAAKYEKTVERHAAALDAVMDQRITMPVEPEPPDDLPDEPEPPDDLDEDATDEDKEQHKKDTEKYESDHAQWEKDGEAYDKAYAKYEKAQDRFDKANDRLVELEDKANDLEMEVDDAADALDTTFTEQQEKLTEAVGKIQDRLVGEIEDDENDDPQPDDPELPDEPDEPDYPDEPDEPDYPDEPEEPDLPHPDDFEDKKEK